MEEEQDQEEIKIQNIEKQIAELQDQLALARANTCNVAKSLLDSCQFNEEEKTYEIEAHIIKGFQAYITEPKMSEDSHVVKIPKFRFTDLIIGLLKWYHEPHIKRLNLILMPDIFKEIPGADQFMRHSGQKARELRLKQTIFKTVKVHYEIKTGRVGILCNVEYKEASDFSFLGDVESRLRKDRFARYKAEDLKPAYQKNRALIKQHLKHRFPNKRIIVQNHSDSVSIFLLNENYS